MTSAHDGSARRWIGKPDEGLEQGGGWVLLMGVVPVGGSAFLMRVVQEGGWTLLMRMVQRCGQVLLT